VNILKGELHQSDLERFSNYTVLSQAGASETYEWEAANDSLVAYAGDQTVLRFRPLIILGDDEDTTQKCRERAFWEARVRAARSIRAKYTVQGWCQSNGDIWPLNALVSIKDPTFGISGTMLIAGVSYRLSQNQGETTELSVVRPDAFDLIEEEITDKDTEDLYPWEKKAE
jgi:prophage tail gpP-like protein